MTGRSQLLRVSEGEEAKMGLDAYQGILKKSNVSADPRLNEQVTCVGQRWERPPKARPPPAFLSDPPSAATRVTQIEG